MDRCHGGKVDANTLAVRAAAAEGGIGTRSSMRQMVVLFVVVVVVEIACCALGIFWRGNPMTKNPMK